MTLEMKGVLMFLFASLAIFSTIEAQSGKNYKRPCKLRHSKTGKTWTIYNTPDGCCDRRGYKTFKMLTRSSECEFLCPAIRALKGCEFMCRWPTCNRDTNGDYDQCETKCETMPHPLLPPVDKEIDCNIFL